MSRPRLCNSAFQKPIFSLALLLMFALVCMVPTVHSDEKNITRAEELQQEFAAGKKWAVIIGINTYRHEGIPDLKYAVADAELLKKTLIEKCGFTEETIVLLTDKQEENLKPSRFSMAVQLQKILENAQPKDTVLVYFSGHGFADDEGQGYLAPRDCVKTDLEFSSYPTSKLKGLLNTCKATQKLLVLDCCHAGADRPVVAKGEGVASEVLGKEFANAAGLLTLASCKREEISSEWKTKEQGLFTYWLVNGLNGKADTDRNGIVDSDELYNYTFNQVSKTATRVLKIKQTPVRIIPSGTVGRFALARLSTIPERPTPGMFTTTFTVKRETETGSPIENATVEILYQSSPDVTPTVLKRGTTDEAGVVKLSGPLTLTQQLRGTFFVYARSGKNEQTWTLPNFKTQPRWTLPLTIKTFAGSKAGELWDNNGLAMKFRWCPPGAFIMGSPESEKDRGENEDQVNVTLTKGFWFGQYEVTQSEWEKLMGTTPWKGALHVKEGASYAANTLRWDDAVKFCEKLSEQERKAGRLPADWSYSLPTEAQWEYACRAGTTTRFSFGDDESKLSEYAWWDGVLGNGNAKNERYAHEVGQKKPNAWNLYDMHGNVWEWCRDWYADSLPGGTNPEVTQEARSRVLRGGSWSSSGGYCRSAYRSSDPSGLRFNDLGFRVAVKFSPVR